MNKRERRRHERHSVPVCAWLEFDGENAVRGMVSHDLSLQGARFATMRPVDAGCPVLVHLQLSPSSQAVECKGRVCWTRKEPNGLHGFGVRFVDLHVEEEDRLGRFLSPGEIRATLAAV